MIAQLTEGLAEQAAALREHSERMIATLERAATQLTAELERSGGRLGPTGAAAAIGAQGSISLAPGAGSEALLLATELAIAGQDREEIAARIRTELGVDPEPVLNRILD